MPKQAPALPPSQHVLLCTSRSQLQTAPSTVLLQEHPQQEQLAQEALSISCTRHRAHKQGTQRKNTDPSKTTSFLLKASEDEDTQVSGLERGYRAEGPTGHRAAVGSRHPLPTPPQEPPAVTQGPTSPR